MSDNELVEIQQMMRTEPARYWADTAMQARYGELLGASDAPVGEDWTGPAPLPASEAERQFSAGGGALAKLADEWQSMASFPELLRNVQAGVQSIVSEFDGREAAAFMERFDSLPEGVVAAVFQEIAMGRPNWLADASQAAIDNFASSPEGAELVREWGSGAARRVAVVKARFARAAVAMGSDAPTFWSWFNSLPANQAKAVLREVGR